MSKARSNLHEEANEILSLKGGNFIPDFGYANQIKYQSNGGWSNIMKFLNNSRVDERINNTIKSRKGEEEIMAQILQSPHKDIILQNPNILKCFVLGNSILPRLKNKDCKKGDKFYKRDTNQAMNDYLNRDSGIRTILNRLDEKHFQSSMYKSIIQKTNNRFRSPLESKRDLSPLIQKQDFNKCM